MRKRLPLRGYLSCSQNANFRLFRNESSKIAIWRRKNFRTSFSSHTLPFRSFRNSTVRIDIIISISSSGIGEKKVHNGKNSQKESLRIVEKENRKLGKTLVCSAFSAASAYQPVCLSHFVRGILVDELNNVEKQNCEFQTRKRSHRDKVKVRCRIPTVAAKAVRTKHI